jgi:hypothetical protein
MSLRSIGALAAARRGYTEDPRLPEWRQAFDEYHAVYLRSGILSRRTVDGMRRWLGQPADVTLRALTNAGWSVHAQPSAAAFFEPTAITLRHEGGVVSELWIGG